MYIEHVMLSLSSNLVNLRSFEDFNSQNMTAEAYALPPHYAASVWLLISFGSLYSKTIFCTQGSEEFDLIQLYKNGEQS